MSRSHRTFQGARRQGQALLVAVLLMMVILLTGILFVAIISYNQQQSVRTVDVLAAQGLAEAGIRWCDENLVNSPQGADWRPPFRAFGEAPYVPANRDTWPIPPVMDTAGVDYGTFGIDQIEDTDDDYYSDFERVRGWHGLVDAVTGAYIRRGYSRLPDVNATPAAVTLPTEIGSVAGKGHILVRVTYDVDPPYEPNDTDLTPDEMSANIKIESIGVVDQEVPVFRYLVAYKPVALTDHALFVTDKNDSGRPAKLGFDPWVDMDSDGVITGPDDYLGTVFTMGGNIFAPSTSYHGPMRFNPTLQLAGVNYNGTLQGSSTQITLTPQPTVLDAEVTGLNSLLITGGYLRTDGLDAADGITEPGSTSNSAIVIERSWDGSLLGVAPTQILPSSDAAFSTGGGLIRDGSRSTDWAGIPRYCQPIAAPEAFDGEGADRYRALTRDSGLMVDLGGTASINLGRYGAGRGVYIDNDADVQFVDDDGVHDIDALMAEWMQVFPDGQYSAENSGWNATYTTYTAPGVEITLFPTETAALEFGALTAQPVPTNLSSDVWWPDHAAGEPGMRMTRSDKTWTWYDGVNLQDSGEATMYRDYPGYPNQVVFAEGNVRIHGSLPVGLPGRDYNLTVVSGGTIYVDGQILCPQDLFGRDPGDGTGGISRQVNTPAVIDEGNTKIALLARDCVCLNATRIVPQLTSGEVSAMPDDPFNPLFDEQHWELSPETVGSIYSNFTMGEPILNAANLGVTALHTARDPGPSAISLTVYNGWTSLWTAFNFGGVLDTTRFYFALPGSTPLLPPAANVEDTLSPDWGFIYNPAGTPNLPWDIRASLDDPNPGAGSIGYAHPYAGVLKSIALSQVDPAIPNLATGSTEYLIKKWKVYEELAGEPIGTIHAKINALIYAENGCWFVIPGTYFDDAQSGAMARRMQRYNYDICVRGSITECFHAEPEMVREWSDKWAWPQATSVGSGASWQTIRYEFDESTRVARDQTITSLAGNIRSSAAGTDIVPLTPQANLPKLPLLPVSRDLIFYGEGS